MADTPQQAEVRRQLRARGEQLAPRMTPGGSASTARRPAARRPARTTPQPADPGTVATGPRGGRQSRRTQPPPDLTDRTRRYVQQTAVKQFRATSRVLVAEFVLALLLIALKPSEPATESAASESTIPQLVSTGIVFILLAAVGAAGPRAQRVSNLFGGLMVLVLAFKNHGTIAASLTSMTTAQTATAPDIAPSLAPGETAPGGSATTGESALLPTPTGAPTFAQQVVTGWRGTVPPLASPSGSGVATSGPVPRG